MNKIIIAIVAVIALTIGWFILNPGATFDYVVNIDQEVTQLETELAQLDALVAAGTLTAEQATAAKVRIITRLDSINTSASESEKARLTPAQRAQLTEGLDRLKNILVTYQATLSVIDDTAVEAEVKARLKRGTGRSDERLELIVADTIADVEETVTDSVQDYAADPALDAQIDAIVTEVEAEVEATEEAEAVAETETTTTETEEEVTTDTTDTESTTSEPEDEEEVTTEATAEAEVELTQ